MVRALLLLLLATVIWGLQAPILKLVLGTFSVGFAAFLRSLVAAALFGFLALRQRPEVERRSGTTGGSIWLVVGGISLGFGNITWNASLTHTSVAAASVLQMCSAIFVAAYGIVMLGERTSRLRVAGLFISLAGMFLVTWNGQSLGGLIESRFFYGNVLAVVSGLAGGVCAITQKVTVPGRRSVSVVAPIFALSAFTCGLFAIPGPALISEFSYLLLAALLLTGLLGMGLGNWLFTESMRGLSASLGGIAIVGWPLVSMLFAAVALDEKPSFYLMSGALITCLGVAAVIASEPTEVKRQE